MLQSLAPLNYVLTVAVICGSLFSIPRDVFSEDNKIAKVLRFDSVNSPLSSDSSQDEAEFKKDTEIKDGSRVYSLAGQSITLLFDEGSQIILGPSTEIIIENWSGRDSKNRRIRKIEVKQGLIWAKIQKIYSQSEPLLFQSKYGIISVRGTEFVLEVGEGGRTNIVRDWLKSAWIESLAEVEIHVFEGEVDVARIPAFLLDPKRRVSVHAGETALVRARMIKPQVQHAFDMKLYEEYLKKVFPNAKIEISKELNNFKRAQLAENRGSLKLNSHDVSVLKDSSTTAKASEVTRESEDSELDNLDKKDLSQPDALKKPKLSGRRARWLSNKKSLEERN